MCGEDTVPNVPCGVESSVRLLLKPFSALLLFLMYRVELKVSFASVLASACASVRVPNVPCGVESPLLFPLRQVFLSFLTYRVELKVYPSR